MIIGHRTVSSAGPFELPHSKRTEADARIVLLLLLHSGARAAPLRLTSHGLHEVSGATLLRSLVAS